MSSLNRPARRPLAALAAVAIAAALVPASASAAGLEVGHLSADATPEGGGSLVAPGAHIAIDETVTNFDAENVVTNLSGTLTSLTPGVTVTAGTSTFPDLGVFGDGRNLDPFTAELSDELQCGQLARFALALQADNGSGEVHFDIPTGLAGPIETHRTPELPLTIPAGDATSSFVDVGTPGYVSELAVRIGRIVHDDVRQLTLTLVAPDGTEVRLSDPAQGAGANYENTVFAVDGGPMDAASAPFTGRYRVEGLERLAGRLMQGRWSLEVTDADGSSGGLVEDWALELAPAVCSLDPVAALVASPAPSEPDAPVTLDASHSTAPRSPIVSYEWDVDGTPGVDEVTTEPTLVRSFAAGTHSVSVRVVDAEDRADTADLNVVVTESPTVQLRSGPTGAATGEEVHLDATGSVDLDGQIVSYEWDLDGDGSFEHSSGTDPTITTMFRLPHEHPVSVRVTDDQGARAVAEIEIVIANRAPAAGLEVPEVAATGRPTMLDASSSSDPDDGIVRYRWDLDGDGTYEHDGGAQPTLSPTFRRRGELQVGVQVVDRSGAIAERTSELPVTDAPLPAVVATPSMARGGDTVAFDASASVDPDGSIVAYAWDLDGNGSYETQTGTTPTASKRYGPSSPDVRVRVTDNHGVSSVGTVRILVANNLPVAEFGFAPQTATAGELVTLDAGASSDEDGPLARYDWDLDGDGSYETTGTAPVTSVRFAEAGSHRVRLRVTDAHGGTAIATATVSVTARSASGTVGSTGAKESGTSTPVAPKGDAKTAVVPTGAKAMTAGLLGSAMQRLSVAAIRGLSLRCKADRAATCAVTATISAADARRLGLARKGAKAPVTVGRGQVKLAAGGETRVTVKLTSTAKRKLKRAKRVLVTLRGTVRSPAGDRVSASRAILLTR